MPEATEVRVYHEDKQGEDRDPAGRRCRLQVWRRYAYDRHFQPVRNIRHTVKLYIRNAKADRIEASKGIRVQIHTREKP